MPQRKSIRSEIPEYTGGVWIRDFMTVYIHTMDKNFLNDSTFSATGPIEYGRYFYHMIF